MTIRLAFRVLFALTFSAALTATAQQVRVGGLEGTGAEFVSNNPATIIDWSRPATASGTVNTASVGWWNVTTPCDNIFTVRFYVIPSNAFVTVMTAERGPFRAVQGINTVTLDPPVAVTPETYIAIRRLAGPDSCGQPYGTFTRDPGHALFTSDDFKNGSIATLNPSYNFRLQAQASNVPSVRVATLPVVGSVAGALGSHFRTSLALGNPDSSTMSSEIHGKFVFRSAGHAGSDSDPSLDFVIPAGGTLNYADIIASMGQSGLGSLDILTTAGITPIATARVFNDAGAAGTSGLSEDAVPSTVLYSSVANVFIPEDLTNFRLNIGIRTFTAGDLLVWVYAADGSYQWSTTKTYQADYFEQVSAAAFTGFPNLPAGGRIVVFAYSQQFIVYGAVTDNRTNDPSMRIGSD
jgi:hypothetical protein